MTFYAIVYRNGERAEHSGNTARSFARCMADRYLAGRWTLPGQVPVDRVETADQYGTISDRRIVGDVWRGIDGDPSPWLCPRCGADVATEDYNCGDCAASNEAGTVPA